MTLWQRRARLFIGVFAVVFAVVVVFAFKRRTPAVGPASISRMDPKAVVESTGGHVFRVKGTREDVAIDFERELTYADGSSKLMNVRITTTNRTDGRVFSVTGQEGEVADNPVRYAINGDVHFSASDGLTAKTEHATYADSDGMLRASGPIAFAKGRLTGHGVGFTYDKNLDIATILSQATVHIAPDEKGADAADIASGTAIFARREKYMRFDRDVKLLRADHVTQADGALAYLSDDEKRVDRVELRGSSRITASKPRVGELLALGGRDMSLKYAGGRTLEHALIVGDAVIELAGDPGKAGRQIAANTLDVTLAPDGSTPTALVGYDAVQLTFPAEPGVPGRSIRAGSLDAKGEPGRGLTSAHFLGNVEYREKGTEVDRVARSAALDVGLKPAMSAIDEAKFIGSVRFEEQKLAAQAAVARYLPDKGILELTGSEPPPGIKVPHVVNEQIAVDAVAIEVTLAGPKLTATGAVKSVLQPAKSPASQNDPKIPDTKLPSILKQDQPANVVADKLYYDGAISKATCTGNANLFQADTSVRADTLVIDDKSGDLTASGKVTTSGTVEQVNAQTKVKERIQSVGTAKEFRYEDAAHRATYTGEAHLIGPQGDVTAPKIELYFKPSGNELERAEAYESVELRESGRKTTGARMTYFATGERYEVTGTPVTILDQCERRTLGKTVTFEKATDTIVVDGQKQFRTESQGGAKCP